MYVYVCVVCVYMYIVCMYYVCMYVIGGYIFIQGEEREGAEYIRSKILKWFICLFGF